MSRIAKQLGLRLPVVQAPMAGGATTVDLVASVCEWGALGFLAAAYLAPDRILAEAAALAARTTRPFGVNLFAPLPIPPAPDPTRALDLIAGFHEELGLDPPGPSNQPVQDHEDRFRAALETGASVLSFTFGLLPADGIAAAKEAGMLVIGTATTVEEAVALETAGVDAVVAQGSEAGAHRGTHGADFDRAMIGTLALVPQVVDAIRVPVIASGGIMDGRGIVAALVLGAEAVQMGTAFLTTHESGAPDVHKEAILSAREDETAVTRAFSGRPARGIVNRFLLAAEEAPTGSILPYPHQNALTRALRTAGAARNRPDVLSLWAGQGVRMARRCAAADLLDRLESEVIAVSRRLGEIGAPTDASEPGSSGGAEERQSSAQGEV